MLPRPVPTPMCLSLRMTICSLLTSASTSTRCCSVGRAPARQAAASPAGSAQEAGHACAHSGPALWRWQLRHTSYDCAKQQPADLHHLLLAALAGGLAAPGILQLQMATSSGKAEQRLFRKLCGCWQICLQWARQLQQTALQLCPYLVFSCGPRHVSLYGNLATAKAPA